MTASRNNKISNKTINQEGMKAKVGKGTAVYEEEADEVYPLPIEEDKNELQEEEVYPPPFDTDDDDDQEGDDDELDEEEVHPLPFEDEEPETKPVDKVKANGKKANADITIDPEFSKLMSPLTAVEVGQLEQNLVENKECLDSLKVWKGRDILLDGHNRLSLCRKNKIEYSIQYVDLPDRKAAHAWIINNQRGRRNLAPEAAAYLRGKEYESEKHPGGSGANQHTRGKEESGKSCHSAKTEIKLAHKHKVSPKTIRNDGKFAQAVDVIAENCGDEAKRLILSKDAKLPRKQVLAIAKLDPEEQAEAFEELKQKARRPKKKSTKAQASSKSTAKQKAAAVDPAGQEAEVRRTPGHQAGSVAQ